MSVRPGGLCPEAGMLCPGRRKPLSCRAAVSGYAPVRRLLSAGSENPAETLPDGSCRSGKPPAWPHLCAKSGVCAKKFPRFGSQEPDRGICVQIGWDTAKGNRGRKIPAKAALFLQHLFQLRHIQQIDGLQFSLVENRPVVENAGQLFGFPQGIHVEKGSGDPLLCAIGL